MKQLLTYTAVMLLLGSLLTACSKGGQDSAVPKQTNVYVFGDKGTNLINEPGGYWKNNVFTPVDSSVSITTGYVSGNNVYVAGTQQSGDFGYWKNGLFTKLDSLQISPEGFLETSAISMFVSGNNVYVLADKEVDVANTRSFLPVYWKNGIVNDFTNGATGVTANNIVVSGNDVYVSGTIYENNYAVSVPKYWKNGVETILAAASDQATTGQIFVSGNDVYVAGTKGKYAGYWENGAFTALTDGSKAGYASVIYVSGNDVYVAGSDGATVECWKNGTVVAALGTGFYLHSMYVSGKDVYILGSESTAVQYWKNGTPTYLTDGVTSYGYAGSIFAITN